VLVTDTSGLLAYFDRKDQHHQRAAAALAGDPGPFVVSPFVIAEVDYLLATRYDAGAELAALEQLSGGAWELPCIDSGGLTKVTEIVARYRDQNIGVCDASLVFLADRYRTARVLTLDLRHFQVLRTLSGHPFQLIPERP
jgi:predicted nucleic acid-binding protein